MSDTASLRPPAHESTATMEPSPRHAPRRRRRRLVILLVAIPPLMLVLGLFVFPAGYSLWCRMTGTALRPNNAPVAAATTVAEGARTIEVLFTAQVLDGMNVRFYADRTSVKVRLGANADNVYHFKNLSDQRLRFRPIHKVSPPAASELFKMVVCFCFNDQTIEPWETKDFPVTFRIEPTLDERTDTITVGYSLHRIDEGREPSAEQERIREQVRTQPGVITPGFDRPAIKDGPPSAAPAPMVLPTAVSSDGVSR